MDAGRKDKLSYCLEIARRESLPVSEMDVQITY